jgi:preprotein translocase subunit YajC
MRDFFRKKIFTVLRSTWVLLIFYLFENQALAMPPAGQGEKGQGPNALPFILMTFAVFYFFIILPGKRREKEQRQKLQSVEKGDEVVTKGGIIGKVTNVAEKVLTIEVSEKTRIKIDREFVHTVQKQNT